MITRRNLLQTAALIPLTPFIKFDEPLTPELLETMGDKYFPPENKTSYDRNYYQNYLIESLKLNKVYTKNQLISLIKKNLSKVLEHEANTVSQLRKEKNVSKDPLCRLRFNNNKYVFYSHTGFFNLCAE